MPHLSLRGSFCDFCSGVLPKHAVADAKVTEKLLQKAAAFVCENIARDLRLMHQLLIGDDVQK